MLLIVLKRNVKLCHQLVIVGVPDDLVTRAICDQRGVAFHVPDFVGEETEGFDAAHRKLGYQRAGIEHVRKLCGGSFTEDDWILFLDADVLLPEGFIEFLQQRAPKLRRDCLYGTIARRNASSHPQFLALSQEAAWPLEGAERQFQLIGYFGLFHSSQIGRLNGIGGDREIHDDECLRRAFGNDANERLPLVVLHYAPGIGEWAGRSRLSLATDHHAPEPADGAGDTGFHELLGLLGEAGLGRWLVIGDSGEVRPPFRVPGVATTRASALESVAYGREGWLVSGDTGEARFTTLAEVIQSSKPDVIFIEHEATVSLLLELVPAMLASERLATLAGRHYGYPQYPPTTAMIELIVGHPSILAKGGYWAVQISAHHDPANGSKLFPEELATPLRYAPLRYHAGDDLPAGVVLWVSEAAEERAAMAKLLELRAMWEGPLAIVAWRADLTSLRIAAAHTRCAYLVASTSGLAVSNRASRNATPTGFEQLATCQRCIRECAWLIWGAHSPFQKTLLVTPNTVLEALDFDAVLASCSKTIPVIADESEGAATDGAFAFYREDAGWRHMSAALRKHLAAQQPGAGGLCRQLRVQASSPPSVLARSKTRLKCAPLSPPRIHISSPQRLEVVGFGAPESLEEMRERWSRWECHNIAGLMLWGDELWERKSPSSSEFRRSKHGSEAMLAALPTLSQALSAILIATYHSESAWVAVVDGNLQPLPGASFPPWNDRETALISSAPSYWLDGAEVRVGVRLDAPAVIFDRCWMKEHLSQALEASVREEINDGNRLVEAEIQQALRVAAERSNRAPRYANLLDYGWTY